MIAQTFINSLGRVRSQGMRGSVAFKDYAVDMDAAPPKRDWGGGARFDWYGNDQAGDCAYASLYDRRRLLAMLEGYTFDGTTEQCLRDYQATGWDGVPGSVSDRGSQMIDVLNQAKVLGVAGEKIRGFARLSPLNRSLMEIAINAFGCVYVGASLTQSVVHDTNDHTWDLPPISQRTGDDLPDHMLGHAFLLTGYDRLSYIATTWGESDWVISNAWADECFDEAWVIFDDSLVRGDRLAPAGFSIDRLRWDLAQLGG